MRRTSFSRSNGSTWDPCGSARAWLGSPTPTPTVVHERRRGFCPAFHCISRISLHVDHFSDVPSGLMSCAESSILAEAESPCICFCNSPCTKYQYSLVEPTLPPFSAPFLPHPVMILTSLRSSLLPLSDGLGLLIPHLWGMSLELAVPLAVAHAESVDGGSQTQHRLACLGLVRKSQAVQEVKMTSL
jgi:hypothetical protein